MRNIAYILLAAFVAFAMSSCSREEKVGEGYNRELALSAIVQDLTSISKQTIGQDFFSVGQSLDVSITSSKSGSTPQSFTYAYGSDGIFRGNPGYRFPLDDSYIASLTAVWPSGNIRSQGIVKDQRTKENYQLANWMTSTTTSASPIEGVMPTTMPVPIIFTRENAMLEFELVGQNNEGLDIESLIIELSSGTQTDAYWAYCDNANGHAELLLAGGTKIISSDNYLIGRVKAESESEYTIIFPQTNIELEAGKRYLVTLVSQGYHMYIYAIIGGWGQKEDGIGVPFRQPTPDINGGFTIETSAQLIAMSYLVRHYNAAQTFSWGTRTYNVDDNFVITPSDTSKYIRIPKSLFSGQVIYKGNVIDTLRYGGYIDIPLFDNNK